MSSGEDLVIIQYFFVFLVSDSRHCAPPLQQSLSNTLTLASIKKVEKKIYVDHLLFDMFPPQAIDLNKKCISYYDSLKGSNPQCLTALR